MHDRAIPTAFTIDAVERTEFMLQRHEFHAQAHAQTARMNRSVGYFGEKHSGYVLSSYDAIAQLAAYLVADLQQFGLVGQ